MLVARPLSRYHGRFVLSSRVVPMPITRQMSFWNDFKDNFKQQYHQNQALKESVEDVKQAASHVSKTTSKITNKAKDTLGSVSDKIKSTVPQSPENTTLKKGAGKGLKKALDFLGNNIPFLSSDSNISSRSQQQTKAEPSADKATATSTNPPTSTTATPPTNTESKATPTQEPATDKPRGPSLKPKTPPPAPATAAVPPLENPEEAPGGGVALTIVPTSEWEKYWQKLGELGQKLNAKVGSFMERILPETTIAATISKIKESNPDFTLHTFLHELQEFVPPVMECVLLADVKAMRPLASDMMFRTFMEIVRASTSRGTFQDSKLLDVSQIELIQADIDENNRPRFVVSFHCQYIYTIRDRAGKVIEGAEDDIKSSGFIMHVLPDPSETTWVCHQIMQTYISSYL